MRKHRLAERLLVDAIGLDVEDVHAEACRWEHVMSDAVELRLMKILDNPTESPYGNPIPGLEELHKESLATPIGEFRDGVEPLDKVRPGDRCGRARARPTDRRAGADRRLRDGLCAGPARCRAARSTRCWTPRVSSSAAVTPAV